VSLTDKQGGMNLTMDPKIIKRLTARGRAAGAKLVRRFDEERAEGEPLSWRDHRWTRLRSAMPAVAELLADLAEAYDAEPAPGQTSYRTLLAQGQDSPYKMTDARREEAGRLFDRAAALGDELRAAMEALETDRPSPPPRARMAPPE
jgi:hypothetical protein